MRPGGKGRVSETGLGAAGCGSAVQAPRKSGASEADGVSGRFGAGVGKRREGQVAAWSGRRRAQEGNGF